MTTVSKLVNKVDWITLGLYFLLVILGWFNIYSSAYDGSTFEFGTRYGKQLIVIIINIILLITFMFVNAHIFPAASYMFYGVIMLALISVLFLGDKTGGSRSWFIIGNFKLQPAEFAKLATALALAKLIGTESFKFMRNLKDFIMVAGLLFVPPLFIVLQGDAGSALVFTAFVIVLYREGLPFHWLLVIFIEVLVFISYFFLPFYLVFIILILLALIFYVVITGDRRKAIQILLLLTGTVIIGFAVIIFARLQIEVHQIIAASVLLVSIYVMVISVVKRKGVSLLIPAVLLLYVGSLYSTEYLFNNVMQDHHRTRINVLFGIEKDLTNVGYNVHQSKIAIGSGGLSGKGYLKGTQTKYDFVPEQDTDFIFCTVGEEWGFLGTSVIIIIFTILLFRIIFIAERQKSAYSRVVGYSLAAILFFHYSVNVAMTIGLAPVIGIPLPFFSYGGSSLLAFSLFLFTFIRLDAERNTLFV